MGRKKIQKVAVTEDPAVNEELRLKKRPRAAPAAEGEVAAVDVEEEPEKSSKKNTYKQRDWKLWYDDLLVYCNAHGTCNCPASYLTPEGLKLGHWLTNQRRNYKKGVMHPERVAILQALVDEGRLWWESDRAGPINIADGWNGWYEDLLSYQSVHGTANVPVKYLSHDGRKLGQWLNNQKRLHRIGKIREERDRLLQALVDQNAMKW